MYDDYLKELEALMKEFFYNQPLPRGLYAVKIAKYKEDKLVSDSGVYYVKIENRQVVKLLQKIRVGVARSSPVFCSESPGMSVKI